MPRNPFDDDPVVTPFDDGPYIAARKTPFDDDAPTAMARNPFDDDVPAATIKTPFDDDTPFKRTQVDVDTGGSSIGELIKDTAVGAAGAVESMVPFVGDQRAGTTGNATGILPAASNLIRGAVRGVGSAVAGQLAVPVPFLGAGVGVGADRASQIAREKGSQAFTDLKQLPGTAIDVATNTAVGMLPGAVGATKGVVGTGIRMATGAGIGGAGSAAVSAANMIREGKDPLAPEQRAELERAAGIGAGFGLVGGGAFKPKGRIPGVIYPKNIEAVASPEAAHGPEFRADVRKDPFAPDQMTAAEIAAAKREGRRDFESLDDPESGNAKTKTYRSGDREFVVTYTTDINNPSVAHIHDLRSSGEGGSFKDVSDQLANDLKADGFKDINFMASGHDNKRQARERLFGGIRNKLLETGQQEGTPVSPMTPDEFNAGDAGGTVPPVESPPTAAGGADEPGGNPQPSDLSPDAQHIADAIVSENVAKREPFNEKVETMRAELFDQFRPFARATEEAAKGGRILPATSDPYKKFRGLERTIIATATKAIDKGMPEFGTGKPLTKGLAEILGPVGARTKEMDILLAARRTPEMQARQEVLPFDPERAAAATKEYLDNPDFKQAVDGYDQWTDAGLKYLVDSGFKSADEVATIKKENTLYAPWERVDEDGNIRMGTSPSAGGKPGGAKDPLKGITHSGSTKKLVSPLQTSTKNVVQIVAAAEKNAAMRTFADLHTIPGMEWLVKPIPADKAGKAANVMSVRRNGVVETYEVHPEVRKTLDSMSTQEQGFLNKFMQFQAQIVRGGVTLDPPFAINNLFRDGFQQSVLSESNKLGIPFANQARGLGLRATKKGRQTWAEWKESAANQAIEYGAVMDREQLLKDINLRARSGNPVWKLAKKAIDPANWGKLIQLSESVGRVGEYDRVKSQQLKKGASLADAKAEAEFQSVNLGDFGMHGRSQVVKTLRKWVPFFGSGMSFTYREAGALKKPSTWIKGATWLGGMELLNHAMNADDPDYWNAPEDQRRRYWRVPPVPGSGGHEVWIPKPVGMITTIITEPVRRVLMGMRGDEKATQNIMSSFLAENIPGGAIPLPPLVKTGMEVVAGDGGYSFFRDKSIVDKSLQRLPERMQAGEKTSLTAQKIAGAADKLRLPDFLRSPQKVDYMISSQFGSGGRRLVEQVFDPAVGSVTGEKAPGDSFLKSLLKRNVSLSGEKGSEVQTRFYDKLENLRKEQAGRKAGGESRVNLGQLPAMEEIAEHISQQRKLMHGASVEERLEIQKRIDGLARRFVIMPAGY